jgi:histidinol phosphatase-like enzyme (inositol monophosphatase family)
MALTNEDITSIKAAAHAMADAARIETLKYFRTDLTAENKASDRFDPVTAADRASEVAMRAIANRLRPLDGVHGEEFGLIEGTSGLTWVLDPIDGTRGYISGSPTWGVLISIRDATRVLFGIIDQPYIGERFVGGFGEAYVQGPMGRRDLKTSNRTKLADAILYSTFPEVGTKAEETAFKALVPQVRLTRYGTDCYAYALIASGQVDLVVEAGLQNYDVQAPIAVIEAAGGIVTDWTGGPVLEGGRVLAAANRDLHASALAVLTKALA